MWKVILNFFNNVKGWFAHVSIKLGKVFLFSKVNYTELYIVVNSIEELDRDDKNKGKERTLLPLKKIIQERMKNKGINAKFDKFLRTNIK